MKTTRFFLLLLMLLATSGLNAQKEEDWSGNEEVFNSGIPRLPVLLNFPITYLHTF